MSKKIPCEIWIGTSTSYFKLGDFDSLSAAKRYISNISDICHSYKHIKRKK